MKRRVILLATNTLLVVLMAIGMVSQVQAQHSVPARHSMPAQHSMPATVIPAGWVDYEVNEIGGGSSLNATGTLLVQGSGADIWGMSDSFHYTSRPAVVGGDQLYAHVDSQTGTSPWAKAGIMIRASLSDATAPYAFLMSTPSNGLALQYRTAVGVLSQNFAAGVAGSATYLKLSSAGNVVTAYTGSDGTSWNQVGSPVTIALGGAPYIGMAVTSHNAGAYNLATFSKIGPDSFVTPVTVVPIGTGVALDLALAANNPLAIASASTPYSGNVAANAIDDPAVSATTYWASAANDTTPWIQVDMGTPYVVQNVVTTWGSAGTPSPATDIPAEFRAASTATPFLGSMNGTTWYIIAGVAPTGGANVITAPFTGHFVMARYIRLKFDNSTTLKSYRLLDLQITGGLMIS